MRQWYYGENDKQIGPVSQELLIDLIKTGKLTGNTYIWSEGMPEWGLVSKSPFAKLVAAGVAPVSSSKPEISQESEEPLQTIQKPVKSTQTLRAGALSSLDPLEQESHLNSQIQKKATIAGSAAPDKASEEGGNISTGPLRVYKHSGTCPVNGYFLVPLLGFLSLFILAPVYAYAIKYIPFIYIDFILIGGYGFALGMVVHFSSKVLKMRNDIVVMTLGAIVGFAGLYMGWVFWIHALIGKIVISPLTLMRVIPIIGEKGTWSLKGSQVTGIVLYLFWLIEAGAIIVIAAFASKIGTPFCERCDEWAETEYQILPLEKNVPIAQVVASLKRGDFEPLMSMPRTSLGEHIYAKINFCSACRKLYVMSLIDVVFKIEKEKEEPKKEETVIVSDLIINEDQFRMLQKHWKYSKNGF